MSTAEISKGEDHLLLQAEYGDCSGGSNKLFKMPLAVAKRFLGRHVDGWDWASSLDLHDHGVCVDVDAYFCKIEPDTAGRPSFYSPWNQVRLTVDAFLDIFWEDIEPK